MQDSTKISKDQKARQGALERALYEAVGTKPKVQWRLQEIEDARNIEHLSRKAVCYKWSQLKGRAMWSKTSKAIDTQMTKPLGLMFHYYTPYTRYRDIGFNI